MADKKINKSAISVRPTQAVLSNYNFFFIFFVEGHNALCVFHKSNAPRKMLVFQTQQEQIIFTLSTESFILFEHTGGCYDC